MPRKRFIDKDNSVSFHVLHRSQRDPLAADETAPQHVLAEVGAAPEENLTQRQRNAKFGIFFDDDYNYLQHLKTSEKQDVVWLQDPVDTKRRKRGGEPAARDDGEASGAAGAAGRALQLPSSVFASHVEEKVGLLNRAAPDHDPPGAAEAALAAVMDDEYEPTGQDDELEDNFFELAGGLASDDDDQEIELEVSDLDSDAELAAGDHFDPDAMFDPNTTRHRPTKSVFTEYSTTSQGQLSTVAMEALNERFEHFMEGEYPDLEVGGLDSEEIAGELDPNSDRLMALVAEFEAAKQKPTIEKETVLRQTTDEPAEDLVYLTVYENASKADRMDCESVLSTYSNTRNRPALIDAGPAKIKIDKKGFVKDDKPKLTKKALAQLERSAGGADGASEEDMSGSEEDSFGRETLVSRISVLSVRPGGETAEERRARKHELKALRRERIQEKKANRMLTKVMSERQAQSQTDKLRANQAIRYH